MKIIKNFFTDEECFDMILTYRKKVVPAAVVKNSFDFSTRISRVYIWKNDLELEKKFNRKKMLFQFTQYTKNQFYNWHSDFETNGNFNRIESFTVLLNDEFTGGEFEIKNVGIIKLLKGDCVSFNSKLDHRVNVLKSGIRYSLVGWVCDS